MSAFYNGLAEIFEIDEKRINSEFDLDAISWDSLAIVSTIALVDNCFNIMLDGQALSACKKIKDIESLIEQSKQR